MMRRCFSFASARFRFFGGGMFSGGQRLATVPYSEGAAFPRSTGGVAAKKHVKNDCAHSMIDWNGYLSCFTVAASCFTVNAPPAADNSESWDLLEKEHMHLSCWRCEGRGMLVLLGVEVELRR
jgi:hypothetical protein